MITDPIFFLPNPRSSLNILSNLDADTNSLKRPHAHIPTEQNLIHTTTPKLFSHCLWHLVAPRKTLLAIFLATKLEVRVLKSIVGMQCSVKRLDGIQVTSQERTDYFRSMEIRSRGGELGGTHRWRGDEGFEMNVAEAQDFG